MGTRITEAQPTLQAKTASIDYLKNLLGTTVPQQQVAGMTPTEQYGQDYLSRYVQSGEPAGYSTSYDYLNKLLTQPTDITKLPEYSAIVGSGTTAMNDAINQALRRSQLGGMGASSSQARSATRAGIQGAQNIVAQLSPLAESERNRQMSASQMLMQLMQLREAMQQGRLGAIQQYGSLPREIQQMILNAQYTQAMAPYTTQANMANLLSGIDIDTTFQNNPTSTDRWMQALGMGGQLGGQLGGAAIMAGAGAPAAGAGTAATGAALLGLSDKRAKENIEDFGNAVRKVKRIEAKVYNYKTDDPIDRRIGVLAQDIEEIMPEAVKEINGVKHVDYGAVATLAAQAVKELAGQIEKLKHKRVA